MTETAANKAARSAERSRNRAATRGPLRFMGLEFPTIAALRAEFPAFATDDAIRAIRAINAQGEMAKVESVERYCAGHLAKARGKAVAGSRKSQFAARASIKRDCKAARRKRA